MSKKQVKQNRTNKVSTATEDIAENISVDNVEENVCEDVTETVNINNEDRIDSELTETATEIPEKKDTFGTVVGCTALNVRKEPTINSEILTIFRGGAKIMIDLRYENDEFYKVVNSAGIEGYCMKRYVSLEE